MIRNLLKCKNTTSDLVLSLKILIFFNLDGWFNSVRFDVMFFTVIHNLSGFQRQTLVYCTQVYGLAMLALLDCGSSSILLHMSVNLGPRQKAHWGMLFSWKRNTTIEAHIILLLRHGFLTVFIHDIFLHLISQSKPWGQARQQWSMRYTCSFHRGEGKQEYLLKMIHLSKHIYHVSHNKLFLCY